MPAVAVVAATIAAGVIATRLDQRLGSIGRLDNVATEAHTIQKGL